MKNSKLPISVIVLCKNEELMLPGCLDCLQWCEQVLVVDTGSSDESKSIARKRGASVVEIVNTSFAQVRTLALKHVTQSWVLYIDADERVTPELAAEIGSSMMSSSIDALTFQRKNIFFGQEFLYGGWERDTVTRGFRKTSLEGWTGDIHESPVWQGTNITLQHPLIHFSHRNVADGLRKSAEWTQLEARAYMQQNTPKVTPLLVLRKFFGELYRRLIRWRGFKDGNAGVYEAIIQACNRAFVYIQVWELQQKPSLPERYTAMDEQLRTEWKSPKHQ